MRQPGKPGRVTGRHLCIVLGLLFAVLLTGCAYSSERPQHIVFPAHPEGMGKNPYIGYAMDSERDAEDRDTDLIYVETSFREISPAERCFDFEALETRCRLKQWQALGKHIVLRFVMDNPSEAAHCDIPDWLRGRLRGGREYSTEYGRGFAPDYTEEALIEAHREAILALGEYFSGYEDPAHRNPDFVAYVELGSLGHWGEWHVLADAGLPEMPLASVRRRYIEPYEAAFPKARLLLRRPFTERPDRAGVYNDVSGNPEETEEWLSWIAEGGAYDQTGEEDGLRAAGALWESAPVGGELTSAIPLRSMLLRHFDRTRALLMKSHASFLGPMIPLLSEAKEQGALSRGEAARFCRNADRLENSLGYRYRVRALEYFPRTGRLVLTIRNDGIAPIYFNYIPCLYIGAQRLPLSVSLREIPGGEEQALSLSLRELLPDTEAEKTVYFGIENADDPRERLSLPMKGGTDGKYPILTFRERSFGVQLRTR